MAMSSFLSRYRGDTAQKEEPGMFNRNRAAVVEPDEVQEPAQADVGGSLMSAAGALSKSNQPNATAFGADSPAPGVMPEQSNGGWLSQNKGQFIAAMGAIAQHFGQTPGQVSAGRMLMQQGSAEMEQQRKDQAAQKLGFGTAEEMTASQALLNMKKTQSDLDTDVVQREHLGMTTTALKERTRLLTKEIDKKFPLELKAIEAEIRANTAKGDHMANEAIMNKPVIKDFGDGIPVTVRQGDLLQLKTHFLNNQIKAEEHRQQGEDAAAEALMAGEKVKIFGKDIPFRLVKKYLHAYAAELQLKGEQAKAKSLSDQYAVETKKAELKVDAEAKKSMIDNGHELLKTISGGTKVEIVNGKEIMRTESPESAASKRMFAANAGQMIANGLRWEDQRIMDMGDQWLNLAYQNKWITTADGVAMSSGVWRPPQGTAPAPTGAAPTPAPQARPSYERTLVGPPALSKPPEVPYGATERAIGGALRLPGTIATEGLKAYREQREYLRGR